MTGEHDSTLRKALFVDPARHPLLAQWVEANPYYWADSLRDLAEAELAAGRLQILLRTPSRPKKKRRGVSVDRLVHATRSRQVSQKDEPAAASRASGGEQAASVSTTPETPQSAAPERATSHVSEQPAPPPPVVQGAGDTTQRHETAQPTPVAGSAVPHSGDFPEKRTQENTYAPEPAHTKAEPGAPEQEDALSQSDEDRLKAIARQHLLGNAF